MRKLRVQISGESSVVSWKQDHRCYTVLYHSTPEGTKVQKVAQSWCCLAHSPIVWKIQIILKNTITEKIVNEPEMIQGAKI
jgi:hypothetical protein